MSGGINVGEKRKAKGVCPICGEPLSDLFGITRCSISTCDYVDYTRADAQVEAAGQTIIREEHARGDHARLLDRLPKLARKRGGMGSVSERTTALMSDPSKDPLENGKVRE